MAAPDPDLEQAFLDTADAEAKAFGPNRRGRQILQFVAMLLAMLLSGAFVGWALFSASH
jgi:hypothetical protein